MNEKQPYEQHLADKLQHLPPPADMNRSWEKMRKLLDDEMPRGGGFGRGRNRWWMAGIITGILMLGAWLADSQFSKKDKPAVAATPNSANSGKTNAGTDDPSPVNKSLRNSLTETVKDSHTPADKTIIQTGSEKEKSAITATSKNTDVSNEPVKNETGSTINSKPNSNNKNNIDGKNLLVKNNNPATSKTTNNVRNNKPSAQLDSKNNSAINTINRQQPAGTNDITGNSNLLKPVKPEDEIVINASAVNKTGIPGLTTPAESVTQEYEAMAAHVLFPESELQKKKALVKSQLSGAGKSRVNHSFAIGFSLPLAFPLGDQKALSYNSNAGVNTVSDYIPSPHLQYHFNDKTYLQTEVQVMSPQHIRPILLYQQKDIIPATNSYVYNSVYAKKLYYFNLPVVIHHSPFKNFYLGTGLQFSSLLSGVALYEQRKYTGGSSQSILMHEQYTRFGGDSLSSRFNNAEMRLLLDVNYYFNKFTVGLRYNQAFSNYVSFRLNNTSGYTFDKNKALQFYLRYNLWEDIKRKKPATSFLSFK